MLRRLSGWLSTRHPSSKFGATKFVYRAYGQVIPNTVDTNSAEFQSNLTAMEALNADLKSNVAAIVQGGGPEAIKRHLSRKKLLPRDRIGQLLDPRSPFLELSQFAGHNLYGADHVPAVIPT